MRIVCLNTWGGTLHDALIPWLAGCGADVLCLQEIVHTPTAPQPWLTYRDGDHVLPQRARLLDEIAAVLPGHREIFCPAGQGALWDGATPVPSLWGLATFVRRDWAVLGQEQGFVHGRFAWQDFGRHPRPRTGHALRLMVPGAGRAVTVAQMHGLRDTAAGKEDTPARMAQARRLAGMVRRVAGPGDAVVVCGDFNVEPDSASFAPPDPAGPARTGYRRRVRRHPDLALRQAGALCRLPAGQPRRHRAPLRGGPRSRSVGPLPAGAGPRSGSAAGLTRPGPFATPAATHVHRRLPWRTLPS